VSVTGVQTTDENLAHKRNIAILFVAVLAAGTAVALIMYSHDRYSLLFYGDAVSHLVGARKLFDWSENPGWSQLGTVWLPLPHFLLVFPSLIDSLFFTGFAGLAISLPCLALTAVFIYKIIERILSAHLQANRWIISYAAFAGALLYALNPNFLYLGITAMTEAPFMLFFAGSAYYLLKWFELYSTADLRKRSKYVLISSIFASAATLCRYEGWVLPVFIITAVVLAEILQLRRRKIGENRSFAKETSRSASISGMVHATKKTSVALMIMASLVSASGIAFWLVYNKVTYGNALEFESQKYYSAAAQALSRPIRETLFLQPLNDFNVYGTTMFIVYGPVVLASAGFGYYLYLRLRKSLSRGDRPRTEKTSFFLLYLLLPAGFTIASLLIGIGEMTLWFNSRFVILIAPLVLVLVSVYISRQPKMIIRNKLFLFAVIGSLFAFQFCLPAYGAVVTLADASAGFDTGSSSYSVAAGEMMRHLYDGEGKIMVITGSSQEHRIMIASGIQLHNFDDITESSSWKKSFYAPWNTDDRFIILGRQPDSDAVSVIKYWQDHRPALDEHYHSVYEDKYYEILARS
jgi:hypothetical protein